jgi:FkbM family methyltransferase
MEIIKKLNVQRLFGRLDKSTFDYSGQSIGILGYKNDHILNNIKKSGTFYESLLLEHLGKMEIAGSVIDVGANIGNHTIFFSKIMNKKVYAFEPHDKAYSVLKLNISTNGVRDLVIPIEKAISSKNGTVGIYSPEADNLGMAKTVGSGTITATTLDNEIGSEKIGLIKIDIEGHELEALKGAQRILKTHRPVLVIEASDKKSKKVIDEYLIKFKYRSGPKFNWTPTYVYEYHGNQDSI